jgi:hypothetical protein
LGLVIDVQYTRVNRLISTSLDHYRARGLNVDGRELSGVRKAKPSASGWHKHRMESGRQQVSSFLVEGHEAFFIDLIGTGGLNDLRKHYQSPGLRPVIGAGEPSTGCFANLLKKLRQTVGPLNVSEAYEGHGPLVLPRSSSEEFDGVLERCDTDFVKLFA